MLSLPIPGVKNNYLTHIILTTKDKEKSSNTLNTSSSSGPDRVQGVLTPVLREMCEKSLNEGKVSNMMRRVPIMPIFKGGDNVSKYRPVVLTYFIVKLFEKIL